MRHFIPLLIAAVCIVTMLLPALSQDLFTLLGMKGSIIWLIVCPTLGAFLLHKSKVQL
jgi:hypothetical protein